MTEMHAQTPPQAPGALASAGTPAAPAASAQAATAAAAAGVPAAAQLRRNLLPGMHAPMRTFMVAVAVMVFLATLAAGAVLLVRLATTEWTAGVVSEATAQLLPGDGESTQALLARAEKAAAVLRKQPGVREARVLSARENRALLEPWLGSAGLSAELPLPALIAIRLDRTRPAAIETLRQALRKAGMRDVQVDAHGRWVRELSDLSRTALWLGIGVLALLVVALVLLVSHAARAALQANRETLQVLHLIGAQDRFIARQVQRHFLRTAFLAAFGGVAAAWLTLLLLAFLAPSAGIGESIFNLLIFNGAQAAQLYILWLLIVIMTTLISLSTARISAMRILADMFRAG